MSAWPCLVCTPAAVTVAVVDKVNSPTLVATAVTELDNTPLTLTSAFLVCGAEQLTVAVILLDDSPCCILVQVAETVAVLERVASPSTTPDT
jgi:hypothetical protein